VSTLGTLTLLVTYDTNNILNCKVERDGLTPQGNTKLVDLSSEISLSRGAQIFVIVQHMLVLDFFLAHWHPTQT
jgi:hypothetical protein